LPLTLFFFFLPTPRFLPFFIVPFFASKEEIERAPPYFFKFADGVIRSSFPQVPSFFAPPLPPFSRPPFHSILWEKRVRFSTKPLLGTMVAPPHIGSNRLLFSALFTLSPRGAIIPLPPSFSPLLCTIFGTSRMWKSPPGVFD